VLSLLIYTNVKMIYSIFNRHKLVEEILFAKISLKISVIKDSTRRLNEIK